MRTKPVFLVCLFSTTTNLLANEPPKASDLPVLPAGMHWTMIWNDEFDGTEIDRSKWNVSPPGKRGEGYWSPENVSLDGKGHIVFRATRQEDRVVGAGIDTFRRFETKGGLFEFKCTLSVPPGYRPAIWITTKSVENVGNEGRDGTEIDVMEQPGRYQKIHQNLHWDGYGRDHKTMGIRAPIKGNLSDWHLFSVWWKQDEYVFYVDGRETWRTSAGGVSQVEEIIKIAIEVPWPASKYDRIEFTEKDIFMCDYARVYKETKNDK